MLLFIKNTLNKFKPLFEFIPMFLITILFISENEIEKHVINTSCQLMISLITILILYLMIRNISNNTYKIFAFVLTGIVWVVLVYVKKNYIPKFLIQAIQ
jgi:hypothetical protein